MLAGPVHWAAGAAVLEETRPAAAPASCHAAVWLVSAIRTAAAAIAPIRRCRGTVATSVGLIVAVLSSILCCPIDASQSRSCCPVWGFTASKTMQKPQQRPHLHPHLGLPGLFTGVCYGGSNLVLGPPASSRHAEAGRDAGGPRAYSALLVNKAGLWGPLVERCFRVLSWR